MVVEKQLGADIVGTGINLDLEVIHFLQAVGRRRMPLRKARHANAKTARLGVQARPVKITDKVHQIGGMLKVVMGAVVTGGIAGHIASERQNVAHMRCGVAC